MRSIFTATLAASALIAVPAMAQTAVPSYQKGSNHSAGGPANELNTGGKATTGTTTGSVAPNSPTTRQAPSLAPGARVPATQEGTTEAGGPANELNRKK